jgi:hypothetical protein
MVHYALCFYWNILHFYCWKRIIEPTDLSVYQTFGIVNFWENILTFWELLILLTKEIYKNIDREHCASITKTNW